MTENRRQGKMVKRIGSFKTPSKRKQDAKGTIYYEGKYDKWHGT